MDDAQKGIVTDEQAIRERLLSKVAEMNGMGGDLAKQKIEGVLTNLPTLRQIIDSSGFFYELMPHFMTDQMRRELEKVGELFLQGSGREGHRHLFLDTGINIFRCIAVEIGSDNHRRWSAYLENDRWHIKNWGKEILRR